MTIAISLFFPSLRAYEVGVAIPTAKPTPSVIASEAVPIEKFMLSILFSLGVVVQILDIFADEILGLK